MGLSNFTPGGAGGNTPPASSGPTPPMPSMASMTGSLDDITDLLLNYNERFKNAGPTLFRDDVITQTISVIIGKNKPNAGPRAWARPRSSKTSPGASPTMIP